MIKGICKNIIVVNDVDNPVIEQAIFIIKPEAYKNGVTQSDMLMAAKKIIEERTFPVVVPKKRRFF